MEVVQYGLPAVLITTPV